jgi:adenylosuccinate lyase
MHVISRKTLRQFWEQHPDSESALVRWFKIMLENVALWHERDISHSSVERMIGPDATATADFMVRRAAGLVQGLVVNVERMRQNLELVGELFFSEGVMLALVHKGMARQAAYELVQRSALATSATLGRGGVAAGQPSFRERLAKDPEIAAKLSVQDLDNAFDLHHHTRFAGAIIDRALRDGA